MKKVNLEIDSDDSLNEDSSEEISLPQVIKRIDEEQVVFRDLMFLPPTSSPPTTADCVPAPARTTVSFVPDESGSIRTIPTVTVKIHQSVHRNKKNLPPHCHKLLFLVGSFL